MARSIAFMIYLVLLLSAVISSFPLQVLHASFIFIIKSSELT
jgi:hypothetical protein